MAKKKTEKVKAEDEVTEDTKHKKMDPKAWEESEEDPEDAAPGVEKKTKAAKQADPSEFEDEDVVVVPEPPRDSKPRGPRDAIWKCKNKHETRGFENIRPECKISSCDAGKELRLVMVYEEKQRRPKNANLGG